MDKKLNSAIVAFTEKFSEEKLLELLRKSIGDDPSDTLTIIADKGLHHIPKELCIGETYVFSSGQINVETDSTTQRFLVERMRELAKVLKEKNWTKVRIIVSGHALLSMQIKLLVYRILHIDSEDIAYFGPDGYRTISVNFRKDVLLASDS
ncbi:hypothetical protein [Ruegeria sp. HKCCSP346]|uniref:hypothetical protein n=1 Tax=Ruegeria sp. HKCCSP346 TaxID=2794830 RepID=UPI001AE3C6EB|nr:hypothetical protein [Ruegeria sp. HKCCSP346]